MNWMTWIFAIWMNLLEKKATFKALKHAASEEAIKEAGIERISYKIQIEKIPITETTNLHFLDRFEHLDLKQVMQ